MEAGEESPVPVFGLQPIIASDRVRYVGEPVAIVVASDPYIAETAAELVLVDIDELDPALESGDALRGEILLHPDAGTNVTLDMEFAGGDADAVFAAADVIVSERFREHRHGATPLETRGLVAEMDDAGRLTVWGPAKVKHFNLGAVASALGLPPERVRFLEPDVGGGFGARGELYPEDYLIPWAAIALGRPVKWVEDRAESLVALNQSREQEVELEVAASADGRLLAFRSRNVCNMGAYMRTNGVVPPMLCAMSMHGPYRWIAYRSHAIGVLTNKTPLGTFRGPGEVEATFARERMLDLVAARLGIDPLELRRRNLADRGRASISGALRSGAGRRPAVRDRRLPRPARRAARARRLPRPAGGASNRGPRGARRGRSRMLGQRERRRLVRVGTRGGRGGRNLHRIRRHRERRPGPADGARAGARGRLRGSLRAHPDLPPRHRHGGGGRGRVRRPRDAVRSGRRAPRGRGDAAKRARARRASDSGVEPDAVEIDGELAVAGDLSVPLAELGASGIGRYEMNGPTHLSFCAAVAVVTVDRATGKVSLRRYAGAYDAGRAINPLLLEGQYTGAAAQGLAGALLEESAYNDSGQPLSATFMDYVMPTAAELPPIESLVFEYAEPANPLGIKGAGNSGIICTHAALANAVADALGSHAPSLTALPLRANSVRALIRATERSLA